ncbi:MAG: metalloregulator ArsR/SmtB family transcription factor [Candidatus Bathyarchaeota archaeon]|nr:metalloregulator ArsR/SmtB family transcription factor [Candidatus Bathyarchaeota archaeon]
MELEDVLASKPRLKILKLINQLGQLNVSDIARRINMNYTATANHLKLLQTEGLLQERTYGRVRLYRLNQDSPKAKAIAELIEAWEKP